MIVFGKDHIIAEWVRHRAPHAQKGWEKFSAIGIAENNRLIAGIVYHDYHGNAIQMSIATESPKWCSKGNLRVLFAYPFVQLGCNRATAITGAQNKKAQDMLDRLGFVHEGTLRQGYPDEDALIFGMLQSECRWIR